MIDQDEREAPPEGQAGGLMIWEVSDAPMVEVAMAAVIDGKVVQMQARYDLAGVDALIASLSDYRARIARRIEHG